MMAIMKGKEKAMVFSFKRHEKEIDIVPERGAVYRGRFEVLDCYSKIDPDYGLMRYLCRTARYTDIRSNNKGYLTIKRKDGTTTTLGRLILEYYAQFDLKLYSIINNSKFEINHKNKDVTDNRVENLEIVTRQGNLYHEQGRPYWNYIIFKTIELQRIQKICLERNQFKIDMEFLRRKSSLLKKRMENDTLDTDVISCLYLEFKYVIWDCVEQDHTHTKNSSNSKNTYNDSIENILPKNYTDFIKKLVNIYDEYIFNTTINKNKQLLKRYQSKYPYLDKILKKFKINDKKIVYKSRLETENKSRTLLFDLYDFLKDTKRYTINDGNILAIVNLIWQTTARGKYDSYRVMYLLGLLNRQRPLKRKRYYNADRTIIHSPSFISIPAYTEDLLKEANKRAKILLDLKIKNLTYFIVRETFGEKIADEVYRNPLLKKNYEKYGLPAQKAFINFLKIDLYLDEDIRKRGFLTTEEILEIFIDKYSKEAEQKKIKLFNGFDNFIRKLLSYNEDVRNELDKLGFAYIGLNNTLIEKIKEYQKQNGISTKVFTQELKRNKKVVILKELLKVN